MRWETSMNIAKTYEIRKNLVGRTGLELEQCLTPLTRRSAEARNVLVAFNSTVVGRLKRGNVEPIHGHHRVDGLLGTGPIG
jgi:hypothetical protein